MTRNRLRDAWMVEGLELALQSRGSRTMARALYTALRGWIQNGNLAAGTRLPSSRALARELVIARNTALAAVDHLAAEGFVTSRAGAGLYVATADFSTGSAQATERETDAPRLSRRGQMLLSHCASLDQASDELESRAFTPGVPALDLFPQRLWQRFMRRHHQRALAAS